MTILVTGGTGGLGKSIVSELLKLSEANVRVMARVDPQTASQSGTEWAVADLTSGVGVSKALRDVDIVIHAATDYVVDPAHADIVSTSRLLQESTAARVSHFCYVSIVGSDRVALPYYGAKVACEALVKESAFSWSIVRSTQFHSLINLVIEGYSKSVLVALLPSDLRFQSVDTAEAAAEVARSALTRNSGMITEIGGPEIMTLGAMAQVWFNQKGRKPSVVPVHIPSLFSADMDNGLSPDPTTWELADAYRHGHSTCAGPHTVGTITWANWLQRHPET